MCQVQRVKNSCGHTNDHVTMQCHFAKEATPSPEPSPTTASFAQGQGHAQTSSSTPVTATAANFSTGSITTAPAPTYSSSYPPSPATTAHGGAGGALLHNMIQREGFDARAQAYCVFAEPKKLESAKGFKCMVLGCEKAD
ncbi:hypothetical protein BJX70DRAFT_365919 [Aspergillus crustosus]